MDYRQTDRCNKWKLFSLFIQAEEPPAGNWLAFRYKASRKTLLAIEPKSGLLFNSNIQLKFCKTLFSLLDLMEAAKGSSDNGFQCMNGNIQRLLTHWNIQFHNGKLFCQYLNLKSPTASFVWRSFIWFCQKEYANDKAKYHMTMTYFVTLKLLNLSLKQNHKPNSLTLALSV